MTTPLVKHTLPRRAYLLASWVALFGLVGCAAPQQNARFTPTTKRPHLALEWRAQLVSGEFWALDPLEFSTPVVAGDEVFVGTSSGNLVALDLASGRTLWKVDTGARIDAPPTVLHERREILVGNDGGVLHAIENGGDVRWTYEVTGEIDGAAIVWQDRVFFQDSKETLHVVDLDSGEFVWDYSREIPDYFTLKGAPEPRIEDGVVYAGFGDGFVVALDAESGDIVWGKDIGGGETKFTDVDSPVHITEQWIYASSYSGGLHCLDKKTGSTRWRVELTGASEPAVVGSRMYVTTASRHIVALDMDSGRVHWMVRHKLSTPTRPSVVGDYLLYGSTEYGTYILDRGTGYPLLQFDPDGGFSAHVTTAGDSALLFSNRGFLYNFRVKQL